MRANSILIIIIRLEHIKPLFSCQLFHSEPAYLVSAMQKKLPDHDLRQPLIYFYPSLMNIFLLKTSTMHRGYIRCDRKGLRVQFADDIFQLGFL